MTIDYEDKAMNTDRKIYVTDKIVAIRNSRVESSARFILRVARLFGELGVALTPAKPKSTRTNHGNPLS